MKLVRQTSPPPGNFGCEIIQHQNELFMFSGYGARGFLDDFLYVFDLKKNIWHSKNIDPPPKIVAGKAVFYNEPKKQFLIYGASEITKISSIDFKVTKQDTPFSLRYFASVLDDDIIYIFGGLLEDGVLKTDSEIVSVLKYFISSNSWEEIETFGDIPKSFKHYKAVIDKNGKIFVNGPEGTLYHFNQNNNHWNLVTRHHFLKRKGTMINIGRYIYFIGSNFDSSIYKYSIPCNNFEVVNSRAYGNIHSNRRHELHCSCIVDLDGKEYIYTFGGWNHNGKYLNHMFCLDVTKEAFFDGIEFLKFIKRKQLFDMKFLFL
eukprot:gene2061-1567_t